MILRRTDQQLSLVMTIASVTITLAFAGLLQQLSQEHSLEQSQSHTWQQC